jgi:hypothetical protein
MKKDELANVLIIPVYIIVSIKIVLWRVLHSSIKNFINFSVLLVCVLILQMLWQLRKLENFLGWYMM